MKFTLQEIGRITGAAIVGGNPTDIAVESIIFDSRSLARRRGTMFAAIATDAADGHRYVMPMYRAGVRLFLVQHVSEAILSECADAIFVVVPSVFTAIEQLGSAARNRLSGRVVAITGSQGKTVVKEMLYRSLAPVCRTWRSPRSWNSRLGVPMSLIEADDTASVCIVECGIDRPGDMAHLQRIVRPDIGILTSITSEHDSGFESDAQKLAEKLLLFIDTPTLIYNSNCAIQRPGIAVQAPDTDRLNTALCRQTLEQLGIDAQVDTTALHVRNRIDVHEGVNDCVMLYDGFTHDLRSLATSLDFMRRRATHSRTCTLISSDFDHCDYRELASLLEHFGVARFIGIGPGLAEASQCISSAVKFESVTSVDNFLNTYDINSFSSETILISGSPEADFRQIKTALEAPRHDTIFEINLDAISHNYNYFRSMLRPDTGLVAMVKASGYGVGALELSRTLQSRGAAYLAVAVIDEAVELRRGGITMPIMVLNPVTTNYRALFSNNLEPSVFSLRELHTLVAEARKAGVAEFKIHIKLDTGMHRVGFTEPEVFDLIHTLSSTPELKVASVFSHLATADCPDESEYTEMQLDTFRRLSDRIATSLPYTIKRHILNTAGILTHPDHQYDMVRLGIGLYGISPLSGSDPNLQPVATLKSTIISLKEWEPGTTIGYGRRGVVQRHSVIATIPIGYADGLDRRLSRGNASFTVRGVACPTIGNICMDQCMIDVTDVPGVEIGDEVEIFGTSPRAELIADTLDTIPYEILTSVSPRVKRIYYSS